MTEVRYAAFLRWMNVGGHRVRGEDLAALLERIELRDAAAFRASGNLVFTATGADDPAELTARIEGHLLQELGYEVPTFLRTAPEMAAIAHRRPFTDEQSVALGGKLQVMLLARAPTPEDVESLLALQSEADLLALAGREVYWLPSGSILDTALDMALIAALSGSSTTRTKGTVEQLYAKHFR